MPDTPIDQSNSIQSIRLKVPTGTVPVPPAGFGQLHSPSPGVLALRLPDGSVVEVGPAAGGGAVADGLLVWGGAPVDVSSDGTNTLMLFDPADESYYSASYVDPGFVLNGSKDGFAVPRSGRYHVDGVITPTEDLGGGTGFYQLYAALCVNGTPTFYGLKSMMLPDGTANGAGPLTSATLALTAGDVLGIGAQSPGRAIKAVGFLSVAYLGDGPS